MMLSRFNIGKSVSKAERFRTYFYSCSLSSAATFHKRQMLSKTVFRSNYAFTKLENKSGLVAVSNQHFMLTVFLT